MAELNVITTLQIRLSSPEFALVIKGLNMLKTANGDYLPVAQKLRNELIHARATQTISMVKASDAALEISS